MAKKLTKKQIEHLEQRLVRERDRALRSLGQFDELAKNSAESQDSDMYSYSDHIADLGTDAMEREKMLLFASKEGRYLYRIEEALRRLAPKMPRHEFGAVADHALDSRGPGPTVRHGAHVRRRRPGGAGIRRLRRAPLRAGVQRARCLDSLRGTA